MRSQTYRSTAEFLDLGVESFVFTFGGPKAEELRMNVRLNVAVVAATINVNSAYFIRSQASKEEGR